MCPCIDRVPLFRARSEDPEKEKAYSCLSVMSLYARSSKQRENACIVESEREMERIRKRRRVAQYRDGEHFWGE